MSAPVGEPLPNVTCVSLAGRGVMIEGPPGSGKSTLALELIDRGAVLVGDDGVVLERRGDALWAHPPENIRGQLEIRSVGIVTVPCASARLALVLRLDPAAPRLPEPAVRTLLGTDLPFLLLRPGEIAQALRIEYALRLYGLA